MAINDWPVTANTFIYANTVFGANSSLFSASPGYWVSSTIPPILTVGQLVDIDLLTGELHLKKMCSMDEVSELFWSVVSNDYKEYLEWKRKKASGQL